MVEPAGMNAIVYDVVGPEADLVEPCREDLVRLLARSRVGGAVPLGHLELAVLAALTLRRAFLVDRAVGQRHRVIGQRQADPVEEDAEGRLATGHAVGEGVDVDQPVVVGVDAQRVRGRRVGEGLEELAGDVSRRGDGGRRGGRRRGVGRSSGRRVGCGGRARSGRIGRRGRRGCRRRSRRRGRVRHAHVRVVRGVDVVLVGPWECVGIPPISGEEDEDETDQDHRPDRERKPTLRGTALVIFDPMLVFTIVDHFFGGTGRSWKIEGREFTATEQRIIHMLLRSVFADLRDAWSPIANIELEYVQSEINPQFAPIEAPAELVLVSSHRIELAGGGGDLHITLPYSMIEPLRETLDSGPANNRVERDPRWSGALREEIEDAEVELRMLLGNSSLTLAELLNLKPDDILPCDFDGKVTLCSPRSAGVPRQLRPVARPAGHEGRRAPAPHPPPYMKH